MDSLEDRIHAAGKSDKFDAAIKKFEKSNKNNTAQSILYDDLCNLGAGPEEADEYVNLFLENSDE